MEVNKGRILKIKNFRNGNFDEKHLIKKSEMRNFQRKSFF
jgi:hypothetical protein